MALTQKQKGCIVSSRSQARDREQETCCHKAARALHGKLTKLPFHFVLTSPSYSVSLDGLLAEYLPFFANAEANHSAEAIMPKEAKRNPETGLKSA